MQKAIIINHELEHWKPILESWLEELEIASSYSNGSDAAYLHLEQGNTHLLSVSASKSGYATMQEVIGKPKSGNTKRRLDLCIFNESHLELVEAKWYEFLGSKISKSDHKYQMKLALSDVANYRNDSQLFVRKHTKTGVVYCTPYFHTVPSEEELRSCIEHIVRESETDAWAFSFIPRDREINYHCEDRIYPGVIMLFKRLHESS